MRAYQFKPLICLSMATLLLSGCGAHSRADNAIGGALAGGLAGGAIGTFCCGDPVHAIPAGILIGGIAGGVTGLLLPPSPSSQTYSNNN